MRAASTCVIDEAPIDSPSQSSDEAPIDSPSQPSAASTNKPMCGLAPVSKTEPCLPGSTDATGQSRAEKHHATETAVAAVSAAQCSQGAGAGAQPDPVCNQGPGAADTDEADADTASVASSRQAGCDTRDSWRHARLPSHVVLALLKREHLVVSGRMHLLTNVKLVEEKRRENLLTKQRQARMQL